MKNQLLILLMLCLFHHIQAQNYSLILPNRESHFLGKDNEIFSIRIDSIGALSGSTAYRNYDIFFQYYDPNSSCMAAIKDSSWIGDKVALDTSNGAFDYYFYSREHVSSGMFGITIKPLAGLNQTWVFTPLPNGEYIEATVSAIVVQNILGSVDSVKTISIQAKNSSNTNIPHLFNNQTIRISKNNGLVKIFDVFNYPLDTTSYTLIGASNPDRGVVNLTARDIYNYNVGDEIHTRSIQQNFLTSFVQVDRRKIYLTKNISQNQDTITYTYERCQTTILYPQNDTLHYFDTLSEIIILSNLEHLNLLNDELLLDNTGHIIFSMNYDYALPKRQKHVANSYYYNASNNCWEMIIGWLPTYRYYDGLGGGYTDSNFPLNADTHQLVYYKKGSEEWGVPLTCTIYNSVTQLSENQDEIKIFPNPSSTTTNISIEDFDAADDWQLELLDITSKKIISTKITEQTSALERNNLPAGLYIYRIVNTQKQKEYTGKLLMN